MKVATVGRHGKKQRILGAVQEFREGEYRNLGVNAKMELIQALIPLGLMEVGKMLEEDVQHLAGERYSREGGLEDVARYGRNRGSVRLGGQRMAIHVPRVRNLRTNSEVRLESVESLRGQGELDEKLLKRVLYGISCRNYEAAAESVPGAIGLSRTSVSREFIQASGEALKAFQGVEARRRKVSCWKNSNQKMRWLAAALLDIEPRLNRLKGQRHPPLLREALQGELGLVQERRVA